ncbi:MAG: hypothetical protein WCD37_01570 [Chloroflexia bacterium]
MGKLIPLDDELYRELEEIAARTGLGGAERVIVEISEVEGSYRRREAARRIKEVYVYMKAKYGRMENSVELIREDRAR